jgi:DNA-binding LacI/PurR family transcriptional regulator
VVNGSTTVAPEIRTNVRRVIQELGYVPNHAARSLVTQRTNSMALVLPDPSTRVVPDDQFLPGIIRGVSQEMAAAGKRLVLMLASSSASRDRIEHYAMAGEVDGVMTAPVPGADPLPTALARIGVPVVCHGRPPARCTVPYVDVDSFGGARAAVARLIGSGRQRIATIAGPQDLTAGVDRLGGYQAELRTFQRRPVVAVGDFTRDSGGAAMRQLLCDDPALDAVFVASDLMAHGALSVLRRAGRRVPDDVAVIGFDDIELARYTEPPLTTIRQPVVQLGHELARQLLRLAGGVEIEAALVLPTSLVVRDSG